MGLFSNGSRRRAYRNTGLFGFGSRQMQPRRRSNSIWSALALGLFGYGVNRFLSGQRSRSNSNPSVGAGSTWGSDDSGNSNGGSFDTGGNGSGQSW